jgi:hypothetical protein
MLFKKDKMKLLSPDLLRPSPDLLASCDPAEA